jgi:hypothetical protein
MPKPLKPAQGPSVSIVALFASTVDFSLKGFAFVLSNTCFKASRAGLGNPPGGLNSSFPEEVP